MKEIVLDKIDVLGKSPIELNNKNRKKIHQYMPVPNNYLVYWADMSFGNNPLGVVITDKALIVKFEKCEKEKNKKGKYKEVKKQLFRMLRWDDIEIDKLAFKEDGKHLKIYYYDDLLTKINYNIKVIDYFNDVKREIEKYNVEDDIKLGFMENINTQASENAINAEVFASTKQGHGIAAEEGLNIIDNLMGEEAEVVGRNNEKNGADRIVNGVEIQTKYCASGKKCINECFNKNDGLFRYYNKKDGKPMKIEVPKDLYADAVKAMESKIKEGKVPGVTDPKEAANIVKKGKLTYNQAKNIAKAGTFESITYDAITGAINCSFALGMTFLVTWSAARIQGKDNEEALQCALAAGIQVFGLSFINYILAAQISRTSINNALKPVSNYIVDKIGYKATQTIVNSIRAMAGKKAISGGAASKQLSKILRSNAIVQAVTFVVFSAPDTYRVLNNKISGSQYTKNIATLVGGMAAAGAGVWGASLATAEVAATLGTTVAPGLGTAIGFVAGAVAGAAGGAVTKVVGDAIVEDDAIRLSRMYNEILTHMVIDFMLSEKEIDILIEELGKIKDKEIRKMFKELLASNDQEKYIINYLNKYFNNIIKRRPVLEEPNEEEIANAFISIGNECTALIAID